MPRWCRRLLLALVGQQVGELGILLPPLLLGAVQALAQISDGFFLLPTLPPPLLLLSLQLAFQGFQLCNGARITRI